MTCMGLTVKFHHERDFTMELKRLYPLHDTEELSGFDGETKNVAYRETYRLSPTGGSTTCLLIDGSGTVRASGIAYCHPKDRFLKAKGRMISLGRAKSALLSEQARILARESEELNHVEPLQVEPAALEDELFTS